MPNATCSVETCDRPLARRGLCYKHAYRLARFGTTDDRGCSVDGCERPHECHGMCSIHRRRLQRYGDPLVRKYRSHGESIQWLRTAVATRDRSNGCWVDGPFDSDDWGYPLAAYEGARGHASVFALIFSGQPRPDGLEVLHSCDNPPCVNPAHLRWGTHAENMAEAAERGRMARGSKNGQARLSEAQVLAIRSDRRSGPTIGRAYGVSSTTVGRIKRRQAWTHLPG